MPVTEQERAEIEAEILDNRYAMARLTFRDFLPFVKIRESGTGVIPFEMWPHIPDMVDDLEFERLIDWAKSRQIAATTILSAYALWHAEFVPNGEVLDLSKGERDAREFLKNSKDMWEELPAPLQMPIKSQNLDMIQFVHGGKIEALPSTKDAGRGRNPTLAIFDEADYHDELDSAYNSVKPGLDDRGGQLIFASTWNPYKIGSLFQKTFQNPDNNFKKRFFAYDVRPGRTPEWYEARKAEYEDKALFEKEYPRTEAEMMAPANAIAYFDLDVIRLMQQDCKPPIETILVGNGVEARIWQKMMLGKRYTAATDTSGATGADYAVTIVKDVSTGMTVADIYSNVLDATELAIASVELLRDYYDSPIWAIEQNKDGVLTLRIALELKYKRVYYRDDDGEKAGWVTWDTAGHMADGSRTVVLGDLKRAIASRLLTIPSKEGLDHFMTMIRNPKKEGRIEAQEGGHDDYVIAEAIAWAIRTQARAAGTQGRRVNPNSDSSFSHSRRRKRRGWAGVMD